MNIKNKLMWGTALCAAIALTACKDTEGTEPGTNPNPDVTVYTYSPATLNNPDNDIMVRFATNSATKELYYMAELASTVDQYIAQNGEEAYFKYVMQNGTKVTEANGAGNYDVVITDLIGLYAITAVATDGKGLGGSAEKFLGLDYVDVVPGEYSFGVLGGKGTIPEGSFATLQICTTDSNIYRLKDVYGEGRNLKMYMMDVTGVDSDGDKYRLFRYYATPTSFTYGDYGQVWVRDVAAWQGSESLAKNANYMNYMYLDDYTCVLRPQYYVSAGNLGYGQGAKSDYFFAND